MLVVQQTKNELKQREITLTQQIKDIKSKIRKYNQLKQEIDNLKDQDGITFSGGDPLFQVEAVLEIAKHAKKNKLYKTPNPKKPVRCKQLNMIFEGSYEAAEYINNKYFGNSKQIKSMAGKIRAAASGIQKSAYGFTWEKV